MKKQKLEEMSDEELRHEEIMLLQGIDNSYDGITRAHERIDEINKILKERADKK